MPSSRPTPARSSPRSASCSRSITTLRLRAGRSSGRCRRTGTCRSANRRRRPRRRSRASAPAARRSASTSSTSYWPGVGSGGSSRGKTRRPGTCDTAPNTSPYICSVERARSCQSFATMPPNPPHAAVSDHMNSASGNDVIGLDDLQRCRGWSAPTVASGDASKNRLMWLWSSTGASSCRENMYSGHAAAMTSSDADHDRPAHLAARRRAAARSARRTTSKPRLTSRGQPAFLALRMHEPRTHDRRERHRDDARHAPPPRRA